MKQFRRESWKNLRKNPVKNFEEFQKEKSRKENERKSSGNGRLSLDNSRQKMAVSSLLPTQPPSRPAAQPPTSPPDDTPRYRSGAADVYNHDAL